MPKQTRVLVITNLFPNNKESTRGIFNKQQFSELAKFCELKLVAPVPFYQKDIPLQEEIEGIKVYHPKYFFTPKILRFLYGYFFYYSLINKVKNIYKDFKFDIILASWAYPDGVGSVLIAKEMNKPIIVKAMGTDINLYTKYFLRRKIISSTLKKADKVIAVSFGLKNRLMQIGIPEDKIEVLLNGVNTELFRPLEQAECRDKFKLPLDQKIILFIGNLVPVKGLEYLIEAFALFLNETKDNISLILVGDGPLKQKLTLKTKEFNIEKNVQFMGKQPYGDIPYWINACDIFCLPSISEGCPNVVIEALSCGKPVVATNVGGIPELVTSKEFGLLVTSKDPNALAKAFHHVFKEDWEHHKIAELIRSNSWAENARKLNGIVRSSVDNFTDFSENKIKIFLKHTLSLIVSKNSILWENSKKKNKIALTFDDGPNSDFTGKVLDILKERGIKATFFLVGKEIKTNKELAERIIKERHNIGAHSYSHNNFQKLNVRERLAEAVLSLKVIKDELGVNTDFFRPPQGTVSFFQVNQCCHNKIRTVLWSFDTCDSKYKTPSQITRRMETHKLKDGEIILLHDDNAYTLEALPKIIDFINGKGFEFVTLSELLS